MKSSFIVLAAAGCLAGPVSARDRAVEAPIQMMMDGFNKGDIASVKAAHVASPTIVDNVAPFVWSGPGAFDQWVADLGRAEAAEGKTDGVVTFAPIVDEVVSGDRAYVVTRSIYAYKQKGKSMREVGYTSFVLAKVGSEWKVASWSWASPSAVVAKQ